MLDRQGDELGREGRYVVLYLHRLVILSPRRVVALDPLELASIRRRSLR
jgi:hypothetical protein